MNQYNEECKREVSESNSVEEGSMNQKVTPFIEKTFGILKERSLASIVSWNYSGCDFVIKDPQEFAEKVLKKNFGHQNLSSFTRQLYLYGFQRAACERKQCGFTHSLFRKNSSLKELAAIRRKKRPEKKTSVKHRLQTEGEIEKNPLLTMDMIKDPKKMPEIETYRLKISEQDRKTEAYPKTIDQETTSFFSEPGRIQQSQFRNLPVNEFLQPESFSVIDVLSDLRKLRLHLQRENEKEFEFEAFLEEFLSQV